MAINWRTTDIEPEDDQECVLVNKTKSYIGGPIWWHKQSGAWMDLFGQMATPEAGTIISRDQVGWWAAWDEIKPSGDVKPEPVKV